MVLRVKSQIGYGSDDSEARLVAGPINGPRYDVVCVADFVDQLYAAGVPDSAEVFVVVEGERDDCAAGKWPVADIGAARTIGGEHLSSLILRYW